MGLFQKIAIKAVTAAALTFGFAGTEFTSPAAAQQQLNSIEVLVNDQAISSHDINQRLRLVIAISGGVNSQEEFLRVREQVVRAMVDERLQLQEAQQFELEIPRARLEQFFERRAQGTGQSAEQFTEALSSIGSSKKTMMLQMNAEIAWSELVNGRLGQFVNVSDVEIESFIERVKSNRGKFEYRLAEIVLLVASSEQEASVKANAVELAARIKEGASFPDIAQQLSASPTAATGGALGWVTEDNLSQFQRQAIEGLDIGSISEPIRTAGGYLILALQDRRRILIADPLDDEVLLHQLFITSETAQDEAKLAKFTNGVNELRQREELSCDDMPDYAALTGSTEQTQIGQLRMRGLQGEIRTALTDLSDKQLTEVLHMDDGVRALIICDRNVAEVVEPDYDLVQNQLEQQRLSMMARRYLRDLRRKAIVDYR